MSADARQRTRAGFFPRQFVTALLVLLATPQPGTTQNAVVRFAVEPLAPVTLGESTQLQVRFTWDGTPPESVLITSDSGVITTPEKITAQEFSARLFVPPFRADDEVRLVVEGAGGGDARKRLFRVKPASLAVAPQDLTFWGIAAPERVVLGVDATAQVSVRLLDRKTGRPYDAARLTAYANVGTVGRFESVGEGIYRATYTPPSTRNPDIAVLIVQDVRLGLVGAVRIPLWGRETFPVDAPARSEVQLIVGPQTFGPVKADYRGVANIPIVVAPGVKTATQVSRSPDGKMTRRAIDLATPSIQRFHAAILPDQVQAGSSAMLHVFVADALPGAPRVSGLSFAAEQGKVGAVRQIEPGHFVARFETPGRLTSSSVDLFVIEESETDNARGTREPRRSYLATIPLHPGFPKRVEIVSAPPRIVRAEAARTPSVAVVRLVDAYDNAVPNRRLDVTMPGADVLGVRPATDGTYRVAVRMKNAIARSVETALRIDIPALPSEAPSATSAPVVLSEKRPSKILYRDPPTRVPGGGRESRIRFAVVDSGGNPVTGEPVEVRARPGDVISVHEDPDGGYSAIYVTPTDGGVNAEFKVRTTSGEFEAVLPIYVTERPLKLGVTPMVGYMDNFGLSRTFRGAVAVDLATNYVARGKLALSFHAGIWGRTRTIDIAVVPGAPSVQAETFFWVTPLLAGLVGTLPVPLVDVQLGGQGGVYLVNSGIVALSSLVAPSAAFRTTWGGEGFVRGGLPLGPGKATLQAGYTYAVLPAEPGSPVAGDVGGFGVLLGYQMVF